MVNTSWWNVAAMGELQVWDSRAEKLWRHNVRDRDMKAVEHEAAIKELGVSHNDILQADREALLTLSVRSWLALSDHLQAKAAKLAAPKQQSVATTGPAPLPWFLESPVNLLLRPPRSASNASPHLLLRSGAEGRQRRRRRAADGDGQHVVLLRQCDNCNLAVACPSYTPGSQCNFAMPVELKTKEQIKGMQQAMIELETQRILQGRFAEEIMGQGLDPQVGKEITRLFDLINRLNRDDPNGAFKILVQGTGAAGASAAQSGGDPLPAVRWPGRRQRPPAAVTAPPTKELDVVDGQVVEDGDSNQSGPSGRIQGCLRSFWGAHLLRSDTPCREIALSRHQGHTRRSGPAVRGSPYLLRRQIAKSPDPKTGALHHAAPTAPSAIWEPLPTTRRDTPTGRGVHRTGSAGSAPVRQRRVDRRDRRIGAWNGLRAPEASARAAGAGTDSSLASCSS